MPVTGVSVGYVTVGALIAYSGIKGATLADTAKAVLSGNLKVTGTEALPSAPVSSVPASGGTPASGGNPASGQAPASGGPVSASEQQWISALLKTMGAPDTAANQASMQDWFKHEEPGWTGSPDYGGESNNPMNTKEPGYGGVLKGDLGALGIPSYPTVADGVAATAATLNNGLYEDIRMQLIAGNGLLTGAEHGLSTWSGGGYTSV